MRSGADTQHCHSSPYPLWRQDCCSEFSFCDKHPNKKQLRRESIYLTYSSRLQLHCGKAKAGTQAATHITFTVRSRERGKASLTGWLMAFCIRIQRGAHFSSSRRCWRDRCSGRREHRSSACNSPTDCEHKAHSS